MIYDPWLSFLGWSVFFIAFVTAIVMFAVKRKFYPVCYMVSVALYIFTVGFTIEAFDFGKNGVLILLAVSSIVFIFLGYYFSTKFNKTKQEVLSRIPQRR